jgi:hypothetical protein
MHKPLIYIAMSIFIINIAYAVDFSYYLNYSKLPYSDSESIALSGTPNTTVLLSYGLYTYGVNEINFSSTGTYILEMFVNITRNASAINYTSIINIGNIANVSFYFYLLNDTPIPTVDYIQLDMNEFEYIVCDYMLPFNTSKELKINGPMGQTVYTEYDATFFTMPDAFIIPPQNYSLLNISIHLNNLSLGVYDRVVDFTVISNNSNVTFHFNINDCVTPIASCDDEYNSMRNACVKINMTSQEVLDCSKYTVEYERCKYNALLSAAESKTISNESVRYVNYTERIPVLDLYDPEIVSAIKELPLSIKQMISQVRQYELDMKSLREQIDKINTEKTELKDQMTNQINEKVKTTVETLTEKDRLQQNTILNYEEKYWKKSTIITIVVLIIIAALGSFLYIKWKESILW